jgi:ankyrin repeat protein
LLLQKDVDLQVAAQSKSLTLPFTLHQSHDHLDVVKLLLEKGADPHVQNKDFHTPLDLARIEDHDKNVAALSVASSVLSPQIHKTQYWTLLRRCITYVKIHSGIGPSH